MLVRQCRLEPLAATDRRDHQVKRVVLRMSAFLNEVIGGLPGSSNLDELGLVLLMALVFAKMCTKPALPVMYDLHESLLSLPEAYAYGVPLQSDRKV
jgi:hypothetical protein